MGALVDTISRKTRRRLRRRGGQCVDTTLLELVQAIAEDTRDDREIVATVVHLLRSGRVRLIGSFRGRRLDAA